MPIVVQSSLSRIQGIRVTLRPISAAPSSISLGNNISFNNVSFELGFSICMLQATPGSSVVSSIKKHSSYFPSQTKVITEVLYEVEAESWLNTRSLSYDRIRPILCTSHDLKINIVYIWKSITLWCITTTFLCRPRYVLKHILFLRWIAALASLQQLIYFQSSGPLCPVKDKAS